MTARRLTSEQQRTVNQLRALAAPYRFRVVLDAEGFPIIPGRYGRIEWYCDGVNCWSCALPWRLLALAVHTDHPRVFQKLWAIRGGVRRQGGDIEMRAVFTVELLGKVASVIGAKRWGGSGRRAESFTRTPGQPATSRCSEPPNAGSQR